MKYPLLVCHLQDIWTDKTGRTRVIPKYPTKKTTLSMRVLLNRAYPTIKVSFFHPFKIYLSS